MKPTAIVLSGGALILSLLSACEKSDFSSNSYAYTDAYSWPQGEGFNEKYTDYGENPFVNASAMPVSTFSIDADGGSYANSRRFLYLGQLPPKESVRIEEYINYFTFDYAEPTGDENVSLQSELSACPWNDSHYLMRIGMKGMTIPESQMPGSNYVFLIDVSGSMASADKLGVLKSGFMALANTLTADDRISIVTYAGSAGVLLSGVKGDEKTKIVEAIAGLDAGGSTAGAEGIVTAYQLAEENFIEGGNNRVILGTDGDFNVGISSEDELIKLIRDQKKSGIYLTVLGVGAGNLNESMMEQLADNGNGNYEYVDNIKQIQKVFVYEKSKFYTVAKDSKIQITFNPSRVEQYRLIGYENRALDSADFNNDTVDAGEIGSGQTITAMYELVLKDGAQGEKFATFDFRYIKPDETQSRLMSLTITGEPVPIGNASENMRFAAAITGFGLLMKKSEYKGELTTGMVHDLAGSAITFDPHLFRQEFIDLISGM